MNLSPTTTIFRERQLGGGLMLGGGAVGSQELVSKVTCIHAKEALHKQKRPAAPPLVSVSDFEKALFSLLLYSSDPTRGT